MKRRPCRSRSVGWLLATALAVPTVAFAQAPAGSPTVAQQASSRGSSRELNAALNRLAANPVDLEALIAAGNAALALGDTEAALGFLARADRLSPRNPQVKATLAGVMVRGEDPYQALRLFDEAERAGANAAILAGDRGLAYDLVGATAEAQRHYRQALASARSDEVTRRLALSQAIARDRRGFEATLLPQLQRHDAAAWRTRVFGLAILGAEQEAITLAQATLPRHLAQAIIPYLRYMPRLTPAQQAAAANLGQFPRAAQIGRDDPRAARYASLAAPRGARGADAGLIPAGEPLGTKATGSRRTEASAKASARETRRQAKQARQAVRSRSTQSRASLKTAPASRAPAAPTPPAVAYAYRQPPRPGHAAAPAPAAARIPPAPAGLPAPIAAAGGGGAASVAASPPVHAAAPRGPVGPVLPGGQAGVTPTSPVSAPATTLSRPASLGSPGAPASPVGAPQTAVGTPPMALPAEPGPTAPVATRPVDLAAVFGDFRPPAEEQQGAIAGVDLSRIAPARPAPASSRTTSPRLVREAPPEPPSASRRSEPTAGAAKGTKLAAKDAKPAKPAAPSYASRIWVQVATGRDREALAFDWRRLTRLAPAAFKGRKAWLSPWGQSSRLLVGPFGSQAQAQAFINQLRAEDVAGFAWTSAAGQVVDAFPER